MSLLIIELLIISALWGWWAYARPREAFIALPILLPTYTVRAMLGPIPTTGLELAVLATIVGWIAHRGKDGLREAWKHSQGFRFPIAAFLVTGLLAVIVSPETFSALGLYRAYFIEPILLFFIGRDVIKNQEDRKNLLENFALITIGIAAWSTIQFFTGWGIPEAWQPWEDRRAVGPFPFPNAIALFIAPIISILFADQLNERGQRLMHSAYGWITIVAGIGAILLAKSDGGLIAVAAAFGVVLCIRKQTRWIGAGLAITGILLVASIPTLRDRVVQNVTFQEWSGKVRVVMWQETLTMLRDRPLFGAGLAAYPATISPYHKATWMEIFQYPHNILLNLWSEIGLLGVVVFGWILWRWIHDAGMTAWIRSRTRESLQSTLPKPSLAFAAIIAILVHGIVDVPYFKNDLAIAFWLFILLTTDRTLLNPPDKHIQTYTDTPLEDSRKIL